MVSIAWTSACVWQPTLWKGSGHLGHWVHNGRADGRTAALPRRFRSRLAICHPEGPRSSSWILARRVLQKYSLPRSQVSRYLSSWNSWSKVRRCYERWWVRPDEKAAWNGSLSENQRQTSPEPRVLWRPEEQKRWLWLRGPGRKYWYQQHVGAGVWILDH